MAKASSGYNTQNQSIKMEKIGEVSLVGPLQESACLAKMLTKRHILCELHIDLTFSSNIDISEYRIRSIAKLSFHNIS